jgi:Domain of unknown function (DUF4136)
VKKLNICIILCSLPLFLCSCYSGGNQFSAILGYEITPYTNISKDPEANFDNNYTFSMLSPDDVGIKAADNPIIEKQHMFFVKNAFESRGYKCVSIDQNPDFLIAVLVTSQYQESYIPPSSVTIPKYVPGNYITTNYQYSDSGSYGNNFGGGTATTFVPGYTVSQTYTTPGQTIGRYYPSVIISVYQTNTRKLIWEGTGVATSTNSDSRVSSQLQIFDILQEFPSCKAENIQNFKTENEIYNNYGLAFLIFTLNGNDYLPAVISTGNDSLAINAGIQQNDVITSVNSVETINKGYSEVLNLMTSSTNELDLTIYRLGQIYNYSLKKPQ